MLMKNVRSGVLIPVIIFLLILLLHTLASANILPQKPAARLGKGSINTIAYSPDGRMIAVASDIGVWLYNSSDLSKIELLEHGFPVVSISFSHDGKILCWSDTGGNSCLWDIAEKRQVGVLEGAAGAIISPDGKVLASGEMQSNRILLWDAVEHKQIASLKEYKGELRCIAFSPDGKIFASGYADGSIYLWDTAKQEQAGVLKGHDGNVSCIAFSPDGKVLASGGAWQDDRTVRLWDIAQQKQIGLLEHPSFLESVAFSPDGKTLAAAGMWREGTVYLWDVAEQKQAGILQGHNRDVTTVVFSPDGRTLASCSSRDQTVRLWDVATQKQLQLLQGFISDFRTISFSPDGRMLASGTNEGTVVLWDVEKREQAGTLAGHSRWINSVAFSPSGKLLASGGGDRTICLWDVSSRKLTGTLGYTDVVTSVVFSPDDEILASVSTDNTVCLWKVNEQKQTGVLKGHDGMVECIAFSPDGKLLASGGYDKTIRIWRVDDQKQLAAMTGHEGPVYSLAFSPDGKTLASGSWDRTIRLWRVSDQKQVGIETEMRLIDFGPDGRLMALSGGRAVDEVSLWYVSGQKQVSLLKEPLDEVSSVALGHDGKWLAVSSGGAILLWQIDMLSKYSESDITDLSETQEKPEEPAVPDLIEAMQDEDPLIHSSAIDALARIGENAVPALVEALTQDDKRLRLGATLALAGMGEAARDAIPALIDLLSEMEPMVHDQDGDYYHPAGIALAEIGEPAVPALIQALSSKPWADYALVLIGEPAVPALAQALTSEDKNIRARAAGALKVMFNWESIEDSELINMAVAGLARALSDKDGDVRESAAKALAEVGGPNKEPPPALIEAIPVLINALSDENPRVRSYAASAFCDIGEPAQDAEPALIQLALNEKNEIVRDQAIKALKEIGTKPHVEVQNIRRQGQLESSVIFAVPPIERIVRIYQDADGSFLITSVNGLVYRLTTDNRFEIIAQGEPFRGITSVLRDAASNDLIIVDRDKHAIFKMSEDGQIRLFLQTEASTSMEDIVQDAESSDFFATDKGKRSLYRINSEGGLTTISTSLEEAREIIQDRKTGDFIVCACKNLIRVKPDGTSMPIIKGGQLNPLVLPNGLVQDQTSGDFFVVDETGSALYRVTSEGMITKVSELPDTPMGMTQDKGTDDFIITIFPSLILRLSGFSTASEAEIAEWLDMGSSGQDRSPD